MIFSVTKNMQTKKIDIKRCPKCDVQGKSIDEVTIKAQLKKEKRETMGSKPDELIFCNSSGCGVVYYSSSNNELFFEEDVKSKVTCKNEDPATPLCYCRKYKKADAQRDMQNMEDKELVQHIKKILSQGKSSCKKTNPKGSCCTADIKKWLKKYGIIWDDEKKFVLTPFKQASVSGKCC